MAREDPQLKLRITEDMKDRLTEAARNNNRSVNAEIVDRLQTSIRADEIAPDEDSFIAHATKSLADAAKETKYQTEVLRWMREQQAATVTLLSAIADSRGVLPPEFYDRLQAMMAKRGSEDSGFPKHPDETDEDE